MSIPALTLALLASSVGAAFKTGTGIWQGLQARKYGETPRPEYEIPESMYSALESARKMASQQGMPGEDLIMENIRQSTQGAVSSAKEVAPTSASLLGAIPEIYGQEMGAKRGLGIAGEEWKTEQQRNLEGMLQNMAGYEEQKWKWDKGEPYDDAMRAAAMMREGSLQNIYGGVSDSAGAVSRYGSYKGLLEEMQNRYGSYKGAAWRDAEQDGTPSDGMSNLDWQKQQYGASPQSMLDILMMQNAMGGYGA